MSDQTTAVLPLDHPVKYSNFHHWLSRSERDDLFIAQLSNRTDVIEYLMLVATRRYNEIYDLD